MSPEPVATPSVSETDQGMLPEYDSPAEEDDGFRSLGAILGEEKSVEQEPEKPRSGIYKYCPNYDRLDDYDKKQVAFWLMQNCERLEAGEVAKTQ